MNPKIQYYPTWSHSSKGASIELYHIRSESKVGPILFVGGVHGDEPEGVALAKEMLSWLSFEVENSRGADLCEIYLIPCLNPDGYFKNRRTNGNGVDLNRNFPSPDWSSEAKAPRYYPGPRSASEPEVQSLVNLIYQIRPRLIVHFHSWKSCVVYTGSAGKKAAEILAKSSGYPAQEDIGYPTPGSLGQYGWLSHKTPVICIEEEAGEKLEKVWPKFKDGIRILVNAKTEL